jgi:hypothetical protein
VLAGAGTLCFCNLVTHENQSRGFAFADFIDFETAVGQQCRFAARQNSSRFGQRGASWCFPAACTQHVQREGASGFHHAR